MHGTCVKILKSYLPKTFIIKINNIFLIVVPCWNYAYSLHSKPNFQHHPKRQVNTSNIFHFPSHASILISMDIVTSFFLFCKNSFGFRFWISFQMRKEFWATFNLVTSSCVMKAESLLTHGTFTPCWKAGFIVLTRAENVIIVCSRKCLW